MVTLRAGHLLERARPLVALPDRTICAMTVAPVFVASIFVLEQGGHLLTHAVVLDHSWSPVHFCVEQADIRKHLIR